MEGKIYRVSTEKPKHAEPENYYFTSEGVFFSYGHHGKLEKLSGHVERGTSDIGRFSIWELREDSKEMREFMERYKAITSN